MSHGQEITFATTSSTVASSTELAQVSQDRDQNERALKELTEKWNQKRKQLDSMTKKASSAGIDSQIIIDTTDDLATLRAKTMEVEELGLKIDEILRTKQDTNTLIEQIGVNYQTELFNDLAK